MALVVGDGPGPVAGRRRAPLLGGLGGSGRGRGSGGVEGLLLRARAGLDRLTPVEVVAAVSVGALLVDTRTECQRDVQGNLPGAICIDRTVLEWRLAPDSPNRIPEAGDPDRVIVVVCRQGYSSSLAAASLQAVGLPRATDMVGGVEAWIAAGLAMSGEPADVRE